MDHYSFSSVVILLKHAVRPVVAVNDKAYVIIQCLVQGEILEFALVYAPQSSHHRAWI